jgi:hypothetical protein
MKVSGVWPTKVSKKSRGYYRVVSESTFNRAYAGSFTRTQYPIAKSLEFITEGWPLSVPVSYNDGGGDGGLRDPSTTEKHLQIKYLTFGTICQENVCTRE